MGIFAAIAQRDRQSVAQLLAEDRALLRARNEQGASLLAFAAYVGDQEILNLILAAGFELDPFEACILGEVSCVQQALEQGWSPDLRAPDGFTPLALAAFFGQRAVFDLLIGQVKDINARADNDQQVGALHAAVARNALDMVEALLEAGGDPNLAQAGGIRPLHVAASHGQSQIVAALAQAGGDPGLFDGNGKNAAAYAREAGHLELENQLSTARTKFTPPSGLASLMILAFASILALSACASAPETPPAVLFVHGWASDARVWAPVQERLAFPTLAPNLASERNWLTTRQLTMDGFAQEIEEARASINADCLVLVAHSNGAYAARQYWRRHPDHVAAMVIIDGTFRRPFATAEAFEAQIAAVAERWSTIQANPLGLERARPQTAALVRAMVGDTAPATATDSLRALLDPSLWSDDRIERPMVFLLADSPQWSDNERAWLQQIAPQASFVSAGQTSHFVQLDDPQLTAQTVLATRNQVRCGP